MSLYQKIKSAITVRQVGEMYGMEPDRHDMVCCPFHSDSDPSMKLNDTYYYCFGCGANGDAIDLTAKLFDLNPRQAAEKLASDFGLDPDKPPANAIALPPPKRGLTDEQWADIAYCLRVLTDYLDLLHDWTFWRPSSCWPFPARSPSSRTASISRTACTICRTALFRRAACSVRTACL